MGVTQNFIYKLDLSLLSSLHERQSRQPFLCMLTALCLYVYGMHVNYW